MLSSFLCVQTALPDVLNSAVGDFNFKNVIGKLGDVMYKFPFSLPPYYIAIIRCLGVLEGLAIQVRLYCAHICVNSGSVHAVSLALMHLVRVRGA